MIEVKCDSAVLVKYSIGLGKLLFSRFVGNSIERIHIPAIDGNSLLNF